MPSLRLLQLSLFSLLTTAHRSPPPYPTNTTKLSFAGVNMAGFDFGNRIDGSFNASELVNIVTHGTALPQMQHFVTVGLNTFRLPVPWQYLVAYHLGGPLDATNFGAYDTLIQGCLDAGAQMCIIDIHNYARWDGQIVGQSSGPDAPSDIHLSSLWGQLAGRYKDEKRVAFDIMNEPHDLDIDVWAGSVQLAVTSIRNATGCNDHVVLLPGTVFCSAGAFVGTSSAAMSRIVNPDGGTENLIFNVHEYLDYDHSGQHTDCVTNNIESSFRPVASWLRQHGRRAMLTESGGGSRAASCLKFLCEQNDFINANADVYVGFVGWAAGGFDVSWVPPYNLTETPVLTGNGYVDQPLVKQCIVDRFGDASGWRSYAG